MHEAIITLGAQAAKNIPDFLAWFKRKDAAPFSVALATGYFCNFLCPVYEQISVGNFSYREKDASKDQLLPGKNIEIKIILPRQLENESFSQCDTTYQREGSKEGVFRSEKNGRDYSFRYVLQRNGRAPATLVIVDVARPLFSVETFYRHGKFFDSKKEAPLKPEEWVKIQAREIKAYTETLLYLHKLKFDRLVKPGFYFP